MLAQGLRRAARTRDAALHAQRTRPDGQDGAGGAFRAWLPAGTYRVSTGLDGAAISPVRVTVRAGVTRRVTFVLRLNAA